MNNKIIITAGGLLLALVLALVVVLPKYQNLQALRDNIKEKEAWLEAQKNHYAKINDIVAQLQQYAEPLAKISDALPQEPSLAALADFLQSNASETGLILKKIVLAGTAVPKEGKKSLKETQVIIQVSGSYNAFKNFLSTLESSSRMIEVQNISVETPLQGLQEQQPVFTLDIKTLSY